MGDATHDETWQKFKLLRIGFAARHFTDGSWKTTLSSVLECLCHDGTTELLDMCVQALIHIFQTRHGINLVDVALECFWDGRIEAMEMLKKHFPLALIQCLEHAKRNVATGYRHTGFNHIIKNTIELIAFTPPMLFHLCCELLLESLIDSGQDTSYLTTTRQGGSLIATDALWSGPWGSSFRHCFEGYSTYVPQVVEASWHMDDIVFGSTNLPLVHSVFSNFENT